MTAVDSEKKHRKTWEKRGKRRKTRENRENRGKTWKNMRKQGKPRENRRIQRLETADILRNVRGEQSRALATRLPE